VRLLVVIPARGGSKAVPRKNLRLVDGLPLVARAVRLARSAANHAGVDARVVVTTDDAAAAAAATAAGAETVTRPAALAADDTPVHAAVSHAVGELGWDGPVLVLQPTCATLTHATLAEALEDWQDNQQGDLADRWATMLGAVDDRHVRWTDRGQDGPRVNRQQLPEAWREAGWFLCAAWPAPGADPAAPQIGFPCHLHELPAWEALDVDTPADLAAARAVTGGCDIAVRTVSGERIGTGHLRRQLALADLLAPRHRVVFDPAELDDWGRDLVESHGHVVGEGRADLFIVDMPNPGPTRRLAPSVVFEHTGPASDPAALVVNDLLPDGRPHALWGWRYSVLDPLFALHRRDRTPPTGRPRVLVTFGGTDPANMTCRAVEALAGLEADVAVVPPPACPGKADRLPGWVTVAHDPVMAAALAHADVVVTSCGRTQIEAACVGTPAVAVPVNPREATHASPPGVLRLPPVWELSGTLNLAGGQLAGAVAHVLGDPALWAELSAAGMAAVDGRGVERVAHAVEGVLLG
jgi:CMP-N-acetylneuraminic acid synthetase/spore coat polysaccharide biosynthesis predicted glycosyltransferase SpsG